MCAAFDHPLVKPADLSQPSALIAVCRVKVREAPSVATDRRLSTYAQVACSRNSRSFAMSCAVGPTLAAEPKDKADCEAGPRNMERRSACVRRESKSYFT